jgi:hypothetical protein
MIAEDRLSSGLVPTELKRKLPVGVFNDRFQTANLSETHDRGQLHNTSTHCPILQINIESK